jgi:hypothetical protein
MKRDRLESNMYPASPDGARPVITRPKRSTFQTSSGSRTASVSVLRISGLSAHRPGTMPRSATSENQRKFAGP